MYKIFNKNNVKIGYSTTPNVAQIISAKNREVLKTEDEIKKTCSCPKNKECPLEGKCTMNNIVYRATVTQSNGEEKSYIGLTSTEFKSRLAVHKHSMVNQNENQTALSKHIWELKDKKMEYSIKWSLVTKGQTYNPTYRVCQLCTKEAYYIVFKPEWAELNSKSEIFSSCRHKKSKLLFATKKRRPPGT